MVRIITVIAYLILAPLLGGLLAGIDRKITARMQGRIGPSVFQPFYDVSKLLNKQVLKINDAQYVFALCFLVFVVITGSLFFAGCDLLLVFFMLTTAAMFLVIEASTTNTPYSVMGSQRELVQMLSYEPMVLLTAIGFYISTGTFNVSEIILSDVPAIKYMPGIFIGFLFILSIKFRKSPFDLSTSHHAHQELVKGVTTELSGKMFAVIEISHWYENVFLIGIVALFFIFNAWWSGILAIVMCAVSYFLEILIDNTSARVKWELMFKLTWVITLIFGAVNVLVLYLIK